MAKLDSIDILKILREFGVADDTAISRQIEHIKMTKPHDKNSLLAFRFKKQNYFILIDSDAEDDIDYIVKQIYGDSQPAANGHLVPNPRDEQMTYGMPYKGKDMYLFTVPENKHRLDVWLAENHPETSRSTWQKHIKAGHIAVDGTVQVSTKFDVASDSVVEINLPDEIDHTSRSLPIIYQDDNVIVVHKPAGILTHSKGSLNDEFTVADFFRRFTSYHLDTNRPGIVHRLDRDTSGVMIGARNEATAKLLQKQFANRTVKKQYIAVCDGIPATLIANIDVPIGRNPSAPSTFRADIKGKAAQTAYEVRATNSDNKSLVLLAPKTGRTHQLRVHLAYIHTPIHGDRVYGTAADRMYLHAYKLEVTIPEGQRRVFEAPIPPEFLADFTQGSI